MLVNQLKLLNFTLFKDAELEFSSGLNVILGENATGKSHLMKIAYTTAAASAQAKVEQKTSKSEFTTFLQDKLLDVFRADRIENLVHQRLEKSEFEVSVGLNTPEPSELCFHCSYPTKAKRKPTEVLVAKMPSSFLNQSPVFIPTREIISLVPAFSKLYKEKGLLFDGTYFDLAMLLQSPSIDEKSLPLTSKSLVNTLESAISASVYWQHAQFYLREGTKSSKKEDKLFEMPLIAEGVRKIAMLSYLIRNGSINQNSILFWDEPEANLNPRLLKLVADILVQLSAAGTQVIIATHSLFLLREIHIQLCQNKASSRFFALEKLGNTVAVHSASSIEEVEPIAALDADLEQSDRYLGLSGED